MLLGQVLGSSALPCSQQRTIQRRFDSNNGLPTPTPLQALGWELILSVFVFILSWKNSQAGLSSRAQVGDSSQSRAPPANHLTASSPLPSGVVNNSHHLVKPSVQDYISSCHCQQHFKVNINYVPS